MPCNMYMYMYSHIHVHLHFWLETTPCHWHAQDVEVVVALEGAEDAEVNIFGRADESVALNHQLITVPNSTL